MLNRDMKVRGSWKATLCVYGGGGGAKGQTHTEGAKRWNSEFVKNLTVKIV